MKRRGERLFELLCLSLSNVLIGLLFACLLFIILLFYTLARLI